MLLKRGGTTFLTLSPFTGATFGVNLTAPNLTVNGALTISGTISGMYTSSQTDTLLAAKQNTITSTSTLQVGTLNIASAAEVSLIRAPASSNLTLTNNNGTVGLTVNASNGHVGIQRVPLTPLHVNGEARVDGVLSANGNAVVSGTLTVSSTGTFAGAVGSTGGGYDPFSTGGRAQIRCVSPNNGANGAIGADFYLGSGGNATGTYGAVEWSHFSNPNGDYMVYRINTDLLCYTIARSNGVVTFHNGLVNSSDACLKSNPVDASTQDALAMLKAVSARTYERTDLPGSGSRLGFIAQEVEQAIPGSWGNLVGSTTVASERGGAEQEIKTLDYARLVCCLWQANRAMLSRIEALEAAAAP
jgi:hypothetical protein